MKQGNLIPSRNFSALPICSFLTPSPWRAGCNPCRFPWRQTCGTSPVALSLPPQSRSVASLRPGSARTGRSGAVLRPDARNRLRSWRISPSTHRFCHLAMAGFLLPLVPGQGFESTLGHTREIGFFPQFTPSVGFIVGVLLYALSGCLRFFGKESFVTRLDVYGHETPCGLRRDAQR